MSTARYDTETRIAEIAAASALVLTLGLLLWPPSAVYWERLAASIGEDATLAFVCLLAGGLGAWVERTSGFALAHVLGGCLLAYGTGMVAIEVLLRPDSPAHLVWYAVLGACLLGGAMLWWVVDRFVGSG